jgi:purine-cytosine permease-like protein
MRRGNQMSNPSWLKAMLTGLIGAATGVVFIAIANLVNPIASLVQVLIIVCIPAFLSAVIGHAIGAREKQKN